MFGDDIVDHEHIVINDAFSPNDFVYEGVLPSGAEFHVNKIAVDCDLLVTEGFIEPHFFAGFQEEERVFYLVFVLRKLLMKIIRIKLYQILTQNWSINA